MSDMYRNGIHLLFTIAMLSSAARAFSTPARSLAINRSVKSTSFFVRSMSTTEEGENSIVDRCKDKIVKALGTEDVTVTGVLISLALKDNVLTY